MVSPQFRAGHHAGGKEIKIGKFSGHAFVLTETRGGHPGDSLLQADSWAFRRMYMSSFALAVKA